MSTQAQQLEAVIIGLEAQRAFLGDAVVDAALVPLRAKLATLAVAQPAEQVLRQVSVLFLDIVGSTNFAQHLDPEDIHSGAIARSSNATPSLGPIHTA